MLKLVLSVMLIFQVVCTDSTNTTDYAYEESSYNETVLMQRYREMQIGNDLSSARQNATAPFPIIQFILGFLRPTRTTKVPSTKPTTISTTKVTSLSTSEQETSKIPSTIPTTVSTTKETSLSTSKQETSKIPSTIPTTVSTTKETSLSTSKQETSKIPSTSESSTSEKHSSVSEATTFLSHSSTSEKPSSTKKEMPPLSIDPAFRGYFNGLVDRMLNRRCKT